MERIEKYFVSCKIGCSLDGDSAALCLPGPGGQVGWSLGQPELVGDSLAHGSRLGLGGLRGPF